MHKHIASNEISEDKNLYNYFVELKYLYVATHETLILALTFLILWYINPDKFDVLPQKGDVLPTLPLKK